MTKENLLRVKLATYQGNYDLIEELILKENTKYIVERCRLKYEVEELEITIDRLHKLITQLRK